MTDIKRLSLAVLAPLMLISLAPACQADDEVVKRTTIIESTGRSGPGSTSVSVSSTKSYSLKFKERLKDLTKQNDQAQTKEWINADEHSKFSAEIDRLTALEEKVESAGFPKTDVDDLEKQVTKLNADLSTASNKPKTTAATKSAPSSTAKKTASGESKTKTTTKKAVTPAKK